MKTDRTGNDASGISTTREDAADIEVEEAFCFPRILIEHQKPDTLVERTFVRRMRALEGLSAFTRLSCLMKIFATIAVSGCSAESVMSRVKIIKTESKFAN